MRPPDGIGVCRIPAGGLAHCWQAATRCCCSSTVNQPGTWTAPGTISMRGRANNPVIDATVPALTGCLAGLQPDETRHVVRAVSSEQTAQVQKIEEVALDPETAGQPGPGEAAWIVGNCQDVIAFGCKANLRGRRPGTDFPDLISPMRAESGHIRNAEV